MPDKLWKATERAIANRLGGKRVGPMGREGPDVIANWLCVECKQRKKLPTWLIDALNQAIDGAGKDRLGVVVLHETGARHDDDIVVMSFEDFAEWFASEL